MGGSVSFRAAVTGAAAGQSTAVTWSVPPAAGTIGTTTGLYVASSTPGTYAVAATSVTDPSKTGSASVTVTASTPSDLDRLRILSSKRIYFQHASVGGQSLGVYDPGGFTGKWGLNKIITDNPGSGTSLGTNATTAAAIPAGTVGEWTHGAYNGAPAQKLSVFDSTVRGGLGGALHFVLLKLGYPDFDQAGNVVGPSPVPVATWFANTYQPTMNALQSAYPTTRIIHVTAPLHKGSTYWGNATIESWNNLLRNAYPGDVFDLAHWESVNADGGTSQKGADGALCINDTWARSSDDHVNQAGSDWLGKKLLQFLADRAQRN
jgi:hypothetical protein